MGPTHLGGVDEYLDEFLDAGRRLQDGVPLKELFAPGETRRSAGCFRCFCRWELDELT